MGPLGFLAACVVIHFSLALLVGDEQGFARLCRRVHRINVISEGGTFHKNHNTHIHTHTNTHTHTNKQTQTHKHTSIALVTLVIQLSRSMALLNTNDQNFSPRLLMLAPAVPFTSSGRSMDSRIADSCFFLMCLCRVCVFFFEVSYFLICIY